MPVSLAFCLPPAELTYKTLGVLTKPARMVSIGIAILFTANHNADVVTAVGQLPHLRL